MSEVFISYRTIESTSLAHDLHKSLTDREISAFLDSESLHESGPLPEFLHDEVATCSVMLCLLGATTLESSWVLQEIETAYQMHKTFIPVIQESFTKPKPPIPESVEYLLSILGERIYDKSNQHYRDSVRKILSFVQTELRKRESMNLNIFPTFRVLIVDEDVEWHQTILNILQNMGLNLVPETAQTFEDGIRLIEAAVEPFHLAVIASQLEPSRLDDRSGLQLGNFLVKSDRQLGCGLVIMTGLSQLEIVDKEEWIIDYGVQVFKKPVHSAQDFVERAKKHILLRRVKHADTRYDETYQIHFVFQDLALQSANWMRPQRIFQPSQAAVPLDIASYQRRKRSLNEWAQNEDREVDFDAEAQSIGDDLGAYFLRDSGIAHNVGKALGAATKAGKKAHIHIVSQEKLLDVPFELLRIEKNPAALHYEITRQLLDAPTNNLTPFFKLVNTLVQEQKPLCILVVAYEQDLAEVTALEALAQQSSLIGLDMSIQPVRVSEQVWEQVREYIQLDSVQILHFAYHASLALPKLISDDEIGVLLKDNALSLVVVNGYATAGSSSVLGQIMRLGVPALLTHQLPIDAQLATLFIAKFYQEMCLSLSLPEALLSTRRHIKLGTRVRQILARVAPILIQQF